MKQRDVPPYLTTAQIALACGITPRAARTECRLAGILERRGKRYYRVGATRLKEALPEMYARVFKHFVVDAESAGHRGS